MKLGKYALWGALGLMSLGGAGAILERNEPVRSETQPLVRKAPAVKVAPVVQKARGTGIMTEAATICRDAETIARSFRAMASPLESEAIISGSDCTKGHAGLALVLTGRTLNVALSDKPNDTVTFAEIMLEDKTLAWTLAYSID